MTTLIGFPFSLNVDGTVATLDDGSDDYHAGELATICLTEQGERELVPDFGMPSPVFGKFDENELLAQISAYGPNVVLKSVGMTFIKDGLQVLDIDFDSASSFNDSDFVDTDPVADYYDDEGISDL